MKGDHQVEMLLMGGLLELVRSGSGLLGIRSSDAGHTHRTQNGPGEQ